VSSPTVRLRPKQKLQAQIYGRIFYDKVHANQNANAYFIFDSKAFSFDYRAKKMSF